MKYKISEYVIVKYDENNFYFFLKKRPKTNARIIRLNAMGKWILNLLEAGKTIDDIIQQIEANYQNLPGRDVILKDIKNCIKSLISVGIIKSEEKQNEDLMVESSSNFSYMKEIEKIQKKYHSEGKPYKVFIELTYRCNLKCRHCYRQEYVYNSDQRNYFLPKERLFKLFDEFEKSGVVEIFLTGGEPFLHPDIYEILEYASKKNFLLSVFTNGNALSELKNVRKIQKLSIYDIRVSIYGRTQHHDSITQVKGSCEKSHRALELLNKYMGIGTGVFVLTKDNFEDYQMVVHEFKSKNIKLSINPILLPTSEGGVQPLKLRITNYQYRKFLSDVEVPLYGSICSAGMSKFRVTAEGKIIPCEYMHEWVFGDIFVNTFNDAVTSRKRKEFLRFFVPIIQKHSCNSCEYRGMCNFCPAVFKIETGDYNVPSQYTCAMTREKEYFLKKISSNQKN